MDRWRSVAQVGTGVLLLLASSACSGSDAGLPSSYSPSTVAPSTAGRSVAADAAAFDGSRPLARLHVQSTQLVDSLRSAGDPAERCEAAGLELDRLGDPAALLREAALVADPDLQEAALEQQAALSSLFAACRGDAPITVAVAVEELDVTNSALAGLLSELGVIPSTPTTVR